MKTLQYINAIFLGLPLLLAAISPLESSLLFYAVWALLPLGIFQGITGLLLFTGAYTKIEWQLYVLGLCVFGIAIWLGWSLALIIPIPMALYFTFLLHIERFKKSEG